MDVTGFGDNEATEYSNSVVYGSSGIGKTYLAGTSAEIGDVLYVNAEGGGIKSVRDEDRKNIDVINISHYDDLNDVINKYLLPHLNGTNKQKMKIESKFKFKGKKIEKLRKYKTVVVDSLTVTQKLSLNYYIKDKEEDIFGEVAPQIKHWMLVGRSIYKLVRYLNSLPINIIYIMGIEKDKDQVSGKNNLQPLIQGEKLLPNILGDVDNIFLLDKKAKNGKDIRYILTEGTEREKAKNRLGLDKYIKEPTFKEIYNKGGII